jgi:hypothetical protein
MSTAHEDEAWLYKKPNAEVVGKNAFVPITAFRKPIFPDRSAERRDQDPKCKSKVVFQTL